MLTSLPLPIPALRLRRLGLGAFGASWFAPNLFFLPARLSAEIPRKFCVKHAGAEGYVLCSVKVKSYKNKTLFRFGPRSAPARALQGLLGLC